MLIVPVNNGENLEKALKVLKNKVIKTKQNQILLSRKEFSKPSVVSRNSKLKAIYKERKNKGL